MEAAEKPLERMSLLEVLERFGWQLGETCGYGRKRLTDPEGRTFELTAHECWQEFRRRHPEKFQHVEVDPFTMRMLEKRAA